MQSVKKRQNWKFNFLFTYTPHFFTKQDKIRVHLVEQIGCKHITIKPNYITFFASCDFYERNFTQLP